MQLSGRFAEAVTYAAEQHGEQMRKGTSIPYISHLLGTASLLLEQPGVTEDQAIAALLHDVVEDTSATVEDVRQRFGDAVAQIVRDCSDTEVDPKPPWTERKSAYLAHLDHVAVTSLQVSLADKVHNATAIRTDLATHGAAVWDRFNAPPPAQHWYYRSLAEVFVRRLTISSIEVKQARKNVEYWIHCDGRPRGFIAVPHGDEQAQQLMDHVKAELGA